MVNDEPSRKPLGYWNDPTNIERELKLVVARLGRFPTFQAMTDAGLGGLIDAICRHGGMSHWRDRLGMPASVKVRKYWKDPANVERELEAWIERHGHFPTTSELQQTGDSMLSAGVSQNGGFPHWRTRLGASSLRKQLGYWKDTGNIERELRTWIEQHGRFPTGTDLRTTANHALRDAMQDHGGMEVWQERLGFSRSRHGPGYWKNAGNIEHALKQWVHEHGRFPTRQQLALSDFGLLNAVSRYGGLTNWRAKLGYGPITPEALRGHADVLARVLISLGVTDTAAFWNALQTRWTMHDLTEAIREFTEEGKLDRFRTLIAAG